MVSFQCDGCQDVVKKPKLDTHSQRCHSSFTCVDCSKTFTGPKDWKGHTSCISEEEKYQKGLYKGKKEANGTNGKKQTKFEPKSIEPQEPKPLEPVSPPKPVDQEGKSIMHPSRLSNTAAVEPTHSRDPFNDARGRGRGGFSAWRGGFAPRGRGFGGGSNSGIWSPHNNRSSRSWSMATGANETPLGTPVRTFSSRSTSPDLAAASLNDAVSQNGAAPDKANADHPKSFPNKDKKLNKAETNGKVKEKRDKKKKEKGVDENKVAEDANGVTKPSADATSSTKHSEPQAQVVEPEAEKGEEDKKKRKRDDGAEESSKKSKKKDVGAVEGPESSKSKKDKKDKDKKSKKEKKPKDSVNEEAKSSEPTASEAPADAVTKGNTTDDSSPDKVEGPKDVAKEKKQKAKNDKKTKASTSETTAAVEISGAKEDSGDIVMGEAAEPISAGESKKRKRSEINGEKTKKKKDTESGEKAKKEKKEKKEKKKADKTLKA